MSRENVEVVQALFEATARRDADAARPLLEWRLHGDLGLDAPQPVSGREALRAFWINFFDIWDDHEMEPLDFSEAPDGRDLVTIRFAAQGKGSSVPIELTYFWVHDIRNRLIVSVDIYLDRAQALEAVGLSN